MKSKLRKKYQASRDEKSSEEIEAESLLIANQLLKLPIWDFENYHLFLSIPEKKEIDTEPLLHILQGKDKNIIISKSDFETREMKHFLLTDSTTIRKNEWDIPEPSGGIEISPSTIDVVFVPLLAFDKKGHRVGYGKGFYDKFLSSCKPEVLKIGLSFFEAEDEIPGILSSDVPMDFCVNPYKIYEF